MPANITQAASCAHRYSPNCLVGEFCKLRLDGVLRSSEKGPVRCNRRCVSLALAASPSRSTIHLRRPRSVLPILSRPGPISELLGDELAMNPRHTALHSPGCVEVALSELRLERRSRRSSRRSEPSRGRRGRTCSPSWEEFAHGQQ